MRWTGYMYGTSHFCTHQHTGYQQRYCILDGGIMTFSSGAGQDFIPSETINVKNTTFKGVCTCMVAYSTSK